MRRDRHLFSTLRIASQVRDADHEVFFQHENQSSPPTMSGCAKRCRRRCRCVKQNLPSIFIGKRGGCQRHEC